MASIALSGKDVIIVNERILNDLADGDAVTLSFPNEIANLKVGKNGNTIYSQNFSGKQADVVVRVIRGSSDDKFLNNLLNQQQLNLEGSVLATGEFIKKIGDGLGGVQNDTYILGGGIFVKLIEAKNNMDGDFEQSVSIYNLKFSQATRVIA